MLLPQFPSARTGARVSKPDLCHADDQIQGFVRVRLAILLTELYPWPLASLRHFAPSDGPISSFMAFTQTDRQQTDDRQTDG